MAMLHPNHRVRYLTVANEFLKDANRLRTDIEHELSLCSNVLQDTDQDCFLCSLVVYEAHNEAYVSLFDYLEEDLEAIVQHALAMERSLREAFRSYRQGVVKVIEKRIEELSKL